MGANRRGSRTHVEHSYGVFPVVVSRIVRLSESFVRVSLTGPSLRYAAAEISCDRAVACDTGMQDAYIKLLVPAPGQVEPTRIELTDTWRGDWFALPEKERGWMRTYTLRASRTAVPGAGLIDGLAQTPQLPTRFSGELVEAQLPAGHLPEVDIDFVVHTETSTDGVARMGPGAGWAAGAQVGDRVSFLAPLAGYSLWASWNAERARSITLAVDETAIPAALSILGDYVARPGTLPMDAGAHIELIAQVLHADDTAEKLWAGTDPHLPALAELPKNVSITWLVRDPLQPSGVQLEAALRRALGLPAQSGTAVDGAKVLDAPAAGVDADELVWGVADDPHAERYVFIAGEASVVKYLRRVCVREAGIPKGQVSFMGYWRVGRTES